jgi:hypothetical protein
MTISILSTIYSQLASMAVTYTDAAAASVNPTVYSLATIPGSIQTEHLPCRLLLSIGQGGGQNNLRILDGAGVVASWSITDFFLLEASAQGEGLHIQAPVLISYCMAYARALAAQFRFLSAPSTETRTVSARILPGVFEYPAGAGVYFYGVKVDLTVEELL